MIRGKIKEVREDGTAVIIASINTAEFVRKNIKECYVDYIDSRPLSDKQRRMCYALTNAIAEFCGEELEMVHLDRKFAFTVDRAEEFPELLEALKEHFSITLSYNDLGNFVCSAIHAALRSVRKTSINELDEFTNYYGEFIPEQVLNPIEDCVETLIQDYLDALKSFLEEED